MIEESFPGSIPSSRIALEAIDYVFFCLCYAISSWDTSTLSRDGHGSSLALFLDSLCICGFAKHLSEWLDMHRARSSGRHWFCDAILEIPPLLPFSSVLLLDSNVFSLITPLLF
jgi:hypothetical protein